MTPRAPRILVVDDEPMIRNIVGRVLSGAGYEVVAMNDGQAGLDAAVGAAVPFDLVVSNNCMPHLNGAEMIARMREEFPDMPILHLDDLSGTIPEDLPSNVSNLPKPFNLDRLLVEVARLLADR